METIEFEGRKFRVTLEPDDSHGAPWDEECGHVHVEKVSHGYGTLNGRSKRPEEYIFHRGCHNTYSYCVNMPHSIKVAITDKWGVDDKTMAQFAVMHGRAPSVREIAVMAVNVNLKYLRDWIVDEWRYVGVCVQLIGPDGKPKGDKYANALWGVSSSGDYWREVAQEIAGNLMHDRRAVWRARLKESRESHYWAMRGVETVET